MQNDDFGPIRQFLSRVLIGTITTSTSFYLTGFNRFKFIGEEEFHKILTSQRSRGLLTISNHSSTIDEPFLMSSIIQRDLYWTPSAIRYAICARDICFRNSILSEFFKLVKALPVERGGGIQQDGMTNVVSQLKRGDWIHMFPEGRVSQNGKMNPIKKGTARLILDADPVVLPFYHEGMSDVLPVKTYIPRMGKEICVILGNCIDFSDIISEYRAGLLTEYVLDDLIS